MKVIKPFRLGVLPRTFELAHKAYLAVGVVVCFDLEDGSVVPDFQIWRAAEALLGSEMPVIDEASPKPRAEVMLDGACFTAGGVPRTAASVRLACGPIDKTLYVVGDRTWGEGGVASDPELFTTMPLGFTRAFGGPTYAQNPIGVGAAPDAAGVHRLPNIEDPKHLLRSRTDTPAPAGFGALGINWPQRWSKIGTYDEKWMKTVAPSLALDFDLAHFMMASEDQQLRGYLRGDEAFTLENVHPDKPVISGKLPGVVGRIFAQQKGPAGELAFKELPTRLDTVRFFPGVMRGVLVFRATLEVEDDEADDVAFVVGAIDEMVDPRPASHYEEVLAVRSDRTKPRGALLRDEDLIPARLLKRSLADDFSLDAEVTRNAGNVQRNMRARMERENERTRGRLVAAGAKPADVVLPPVADLTDMGRPEELIAAIDQLLTEDHAEKAKRDAEAADAKSRALFASRGLDYDAEKEKIGRASAGPPKFSADAEMERLRDMQTLVRNAGAPSADLDRVIADPETYRKLREAEANMRATYRATAHVAPYAAETLSGEKRAAVRVFVVAAHRDGVSLAGHDLTGADLSELELPGLDLRGALLERADLSGADLTGADLSGAVLARADLSDANLTRAVLREANLGAASLANANLTDVADAKGVVFTKADLTEANLTGCSLANPSFYDAKLDRVVFTRLRAEGAIFFRNELPSAPFDGAQLKQCAFLECELGGASFAGATLDRVTFAGCNLDGASFVSAEMPNTRFVRGTTARTVDFRGAKASTSCAAAIDFTDADFSGAELDSVVFSRAILRGAKFYRAKGRGAHFQRADCAGASFVAADLRGAIFMKSKLARADFTGANLHASNFLRAVGDQQTSFESALVTGVVRGAKI